MFLVASGASLLVAPKQLRLEVATDLCLDLVVHNTLLLEIFVRLLE